MTKEVAILGTGFLGRVLVRKFASVAVPVAHTFNRHRIFPDSVHFDIFRHDIASAFPLAEIDVVILASRFEDCRDTEQVFQAMGRFLAQLKGKRVIYVSSDAVFDGARKMYREDDLPTPVTQYGKNKLLCENLVRKSVPDHCILRTSYIYGYSLGALDPRLAHAKRVLGGGKAFERFENMYKSPIEVSQLASIVVAVSQAGVIGTFHAAGARVSVHEFFLRALRALGVSHDNLRPIPIPAIVPPDCLVDTSLDTSLLESTIDFLPTTIEASLQQFGPSLGDSQSVTLDRKATA